MNKIYLDIETIPLPPEKREFTKPIFEEMSFGNIKDPEKKQAKYDQAVQDWEEGTDAALRAVTGQLAILGFFNGEYQPYCVDGNEAEVIDRFFKFVDNAYKNDSIEMIGHNIISFDIPFLIRRALINNVNVPTWVINDLNQYHPKLFKDTMRIWQYGDRRHYVKLEYLCGAFGIKIKESEVTGATFYKFYDKEREKAIDYNRQDVLALPKLCKRMGI